MTPGVHTECLTSLNVQNEIQHSSVMSFTAQLTLVCYTFSKNKLLKTFHESVLNLMYVQTFLLLLFDFPVNDGSIPAGYTS